MRGRFNPGDGQLYVCGLSAWGSTQPQLGGLYRIRKKDKPLTIPVGIKAKKDGILLTFTGKLNSGSAQTITNYTVKTWDLLRSRKYGSKHYNVQTLEVAGAELTADKKSVMISLPAIQPTWVMEITYTLKNENGKAIDGSVQNTIHQLGESLTLSMAK